MKVVKFKKRGENMTIEQEGLFIEVVDTANSIWAKRDLHMNFSEYVDAGYFRGAKYCRDLATKHISKGWTGPEFFEAVVEEIYFLFKSEGLEAPINPKYAFLA